jgi:hypothetical protein
MVAGSQVFFTAVPSFSGDKTAIGNLTIDRISEGANEEDPDYIYSIDPITSRIPANSGLTQLVYTLPTTSDVYWLLYKSTFQEWSVLRSAQATLATSYAPNSETVWDVLLAITDITGYKVRRYFRGWEVGESIFFPIRRLEYFPVGQPIFSGDLTELGTETRFSDSYGEILSMQTEDTNAIVSHLIPYGGGGGSSRFDIRAATIDLILLDEYPEMNWGVINNQYYIYNMDLDGHAVWAEESFSEISPLDPSSQTSRREAANQLVRAACEWLRERATSEITYSVDIFTIGEPRPGDVLDLDYSGADPIATTGTTLVVSEVNHEVAADTGYRVTRLTLNRKGAHKHGGPQSVGKALLRLQRGARHGNFSGSGDARITFDGMDFGTEGTIQAKSGNMTVRSLTGDVVIISDTGDMNVNADQLHVTGNIKTDADLVAGAGFVIADEVSTTQEHRLSAFLLRGIPRIKVVTRKRAI